MSLFKDIITCLFVVNTSEAGTGDVDVTVTCSSGHVMVRQHRLDEFQQKFTFVPSLPIKHDVSITFNKQHISGIHHSDTYLERRFPYSQFPGQVFPA